MKKPTPIRAPQAQTAAQPDRRGGTALLPTATLQPGEVLPSASQAWLPGSSRAPCASAQATWGSHHRGTEPCQDSGCQTPSWSKMWVSKT